jgi:hypothetical protein
VPLLDASVSIVGVEENGKLDDACTYEPSGTRDAFACLNYCFRNFSFQFQGMEREPQFDLSLRRRRSIL